MGIFGKLLLEGKRGQGDKKQSHIILVPAHPMGRMLCPLLKLFKGGFLSKRKHQMDRNDEKGIEHGP